MISDITKEFLHKHPEECAREIENFSLDDILFFIKSLSLKEIVSVLSYLMPSIAATCLEKLTENTQKEIIKALPLNALKTIIPRINNPLRTELLSVLPRNAQIALEHALQFSAQTVGAFMDTTALFLPLEHNLKQVLTLIREFPHDTGATLFCIDHEGELQGMVSLKDIAIGSHAATLNHLIKPCPLVLQTNTSIKSIATHVAWEEQSILPVVDEHHVLLGTLAYEKIVSTLQNILFGGRKETLLNSAADILFMFSHTTEDIVNELHHMLSLHKGKK